MSRIRYICIPNENVSLMPTAKEVSEYFLKLSQPEVGDYISNLKLQKLLYYAQGYHLALFNDLLFNEEIKSWQYGPVVESIYHEYKDNGAAAIPVPDRIQEGNISDEQKELLAEVYEIMGQFSALRLMHMTHQESPWVDTEINAEITPDKLKEYFLTQID